MLQGQQKYRSERWIDIVNNVNKPKKTPEEIVKEVIEKGGLTVKT